MTVSTTTRSIAYTGDGVTVDFPIPFPWISDAHITAQLKLISSGALTNLVNGTDFKLTGAGTGSGTLTFLVSAPSSLYQVLIARTLPILQLDNYTPHGQIAAETVETDLDYAIMCIQQLSDSIAGLGGTGYSFQNLGTGQGHVYSGISGTTVQLKSLKQAGNVTITETANEITISGAGALDLTADYAWTGRHTWTKQAARTSPSLTLKSLQGAVDITDSSILLTSDYVAAFDIRKRTDVAVEAPVDGSWGGNFGIYLQHAVSGTAGVNGTLAGGVRAQVETTQAHGVGVVNDAVAFYGGLYNNGTDVGGFGLHIDAWHAGAASTAGHATYGGSFEVYKNIAGGVVAGVVVRQQGTQAMDFGLSIIHASAGLGQLKRGIQLGSPSYANGGILGAPGATTLFDIGIDLSWGVYTWGALSIPGDQYVIWSASNAAQSATPDRTCQSQFKRSTGNWQLDNAGTFKFGVNMTTGNLFGPGTNEMLSLWDTTTPWAISMTSTNKVSNTANGGTQTFGVTATSLRAADYAGAIVAKIGGTTVKIPYMSN